MRKKTIGIVLEFGFHDLKKYIYSGLGKKISEHFDIIWLTIQKNSKEFHRLFSETGFPIVYFNATDFIGSSITESRNISVRRAWMSKYKLGEFHNYRKLNISIIRKLILGNKIIKQFYENRTLSIIESRYYNDKVNDVIKEKNITQILGTGYSSSFSKSVFVTAKKNNLPCHLLVNNWKDLYINDFVPFRFLSSLFLWDENMKSSYKYHMPYLKSNTLIVSGNPVFDYLKISHPKYNRQYYSRKYNINTKADWLYYTMMSPLAGINEEEIVKTIAKELAKKFNRVEKVILLRRNPQHKNTDFNGMEFPDNVIITNHYSYFDLEKDIHTQSPEGEQEWIDLLHHCELNLSVPSTVTLEFLTLNKPVINIGFGPDGKPDERLKQHFEAGFYKPLFKDERVKKVERIEELIPAINSSKRISTGQIIAEEKRLASDTIIKRLLEEGSK